jgi:GT2 family glycosyltransferase
VTYKSRALIDRCLAPLLHRDDLEIIIWENASGDGIGDHIRQNYAQHDFIKFFESGENLGFSKGNNRALEFCSGRYCLLLNPDAFMDDAATVDALVQFLDSQPDVGLVGPRLINSDGTHQAGDAGWRISLPAIMVHAFLLQRFFPRLPGIYLTGGRLLGRQVVDLDWVCGACVLVRKDVFAQVGGFDESIFMYGEDIDLGARVRDAGWRVCYLPQISVLHLQGATQKTEGDLFFSTKWIDNIALRFAAISTAPGFVVMRLSLAAGFGFRAAIWFLASLLSPKGMARQRARIMWRYAAHVMALPSYRSLVSANLRALH